jgi:hypothetical protein
LKNGTQSANQTIEVSQMKVLLLSALMVSGTLTSLAADSPSLTGKWKIHSSIAGNDSDSECTLTQTDNDVSGTCKTAEGKDAKATGKVDGAKASWSFESEYNGTPLTIKYTATLDATVGKIAGTVSVDPFGVEGDFTATLDK